MRQIEKIPTTELRPGDMAAPFAGMKLERIETVRVGVHNGREVMIVITRTQDGPEELTESNLYHTGHRHTWRRLRDTVAA